MVSALVDFINGSCGDRGELVAAAIALADCFRHCTYFIVVAFVFDSRTKDVSRITGNEGIRKYYRLAIAFYFANREAIG